MLNNEYTKYMKQYILFGLTLLMAFPLSVHAQDEDVYEEEEVVVKRTFTPKQKKYPTRTIKGSVIDAATKKPVGGAIVRAAEIDGYSVLTDEDGTYTLKLPTFATAIVVNTTDYNLVRMGLVKGEQQQTVSLYSTNFKPEYELQTNMRGDYKANDFKYTPSINIKDEIQNQLGGQVYTVTRNGTPGVGSVMFMQGLNSLNVNAQPLIVIDGVIIEQQYNRTSLHDGMYNDTFQTSTLPILRRSRCFTMVRLSMEPRAAMASS